MDVGEVRQLWDKHVANMNKLTSGAYAIPENFRRAFGALKAKHYKSAMPQADKVVVAVREAKALQAQYWQQFAAGRDNVPPRFEEADDDVRLAFVTSNPGSTFTALASARSRNGAYYALNEATGEITTTNS
jgi:hypothetical protein